MKADHQKDQVKLGNFSPTPILQEEERGWKLS